MENNKINLIKVESTIKLKYLYDNSCPTMEGLSLEETDSIVKFAEEQGHKKFPLNIYVIKGSFMNEVCHLTKRNSYPEDLNIVSIEMNLNPIVKMEYGFRWMDDIIDNNAEREKFHPFDPYRFVEDGKFKDSVNKGWDKYEKLLEAIGSKKLLDSLVRSMGDNLLEEHMDYIADMEDFEFKFGDSKVSEYYMDNKELKEIFRDLPEGISGWVSDYYIQIENNHFYEKEDILEDYKDIKELLKENYPNYKVTEPKIFKDDHGWTFKLESFRIIKNNKFAEHFTDNKEEDNKMLEQLASYLNKYYEEEGLEITVDYEGDKATLVCHNYLSEEEQTSLEEVSTYWLEERLDENRYREIYVSKNNNAFYLSLEK